MTDLINNIIPEKYRAYALALLALSPYITRALHALINGRGLKGIFGAIWLGTNTPSTNAQAGPQLRTPLMLLFFATSLLALCTVTGCLGGTYKAINASDATVRGAMTGWGIYVSQWHPGTNDELRVKQAFDIYKNSELAVIDASLSLSTNSTATNIVSDAVIAEQAAQADLLNILASITNNPTH